MKQRNLFATLLLGLCCLGLIAIPAMPDSVGATPPAQAHSVVPAALLPDLALDGFTMTPTRPKVNQPVIFATTVHNIGAGEGPGWRVNLYIDPAKQPPTTTTVEDNTVASFVRMPAGSSASIEFSNYTFTTPGCQHVVYAWADPRQGISESDETNNLRVINVCVDPDQTAQPGADTYEPDNPCSATVPSIPTDGTPQNRSFSPVGDEDYVKFQVTKGISYTITSAGTGQDAEPSIEISDSCAFTPAFGTSTRVTRDFPSSGVYYLKLTNDAANPDPNQTIYQLTIRAEAQATTGVRPIPSAVAPTSGINNITTTMVITGTQFLFPTMSELCLVTNNTCSNNCTQLLETTWKSAEKLSAIVQANLDPGNYCFQTTNPDGARGVLANAFTVLPSNPDPRTVTPAQAYNDVITDIHIYGFNFVDGLTATLGSYNLENLRVIDPKHLIATLPRDMLPGSYELALRKNGLVGTLPQAFTILTAQDDLFAQQEELWINPVVPRSGQPMELGVVIHRHGGAATLSAPAVRFLVNNATVGTATAPLLMPDGSASTSRVSFTPSTTGIYTVTAIIDPDQTVTEQNRSNNVVTRTFTVQGTAADLLAPRTDSLRIGASATDLTEVITTSTPLVYLFTQATDDFPPAPAGSGVQEVRYIELEYNQGANLWVPVRDSQWLNYTLNSSGYRWELTPTGGIHYIQAWTKDQAGNISRYPNQKGINYLPPVERVERNQTRVYRQNLAVGQCLTVKLKPLSGDSDLYIWPPDWKTGNPPWVSNLTNAAADDFTLTGSQVTVAGEYQIEVYGYSNTTYELSIQPDVCTFSNISIQGGVEPTKQLRSNPLILTDPPRDIPTTETTYRKVYLPLTTR